MTLETPRERYNRIEQEIADAAPPLQAIGPAIGESDRAAAGDRELLVDLAPLHVPGYCSDHPNVRLVTHKRAGVTWWGHGRTDLEIVCPGPGHSPYDRDRCRWCGQTLDERDELVGYVSPKRAYCRRRGDMCRIDAHRARRRGRPNAPAAIR